ncbi:MAG: hypothetical protein RBR26_10610 [Methanosarcina mazei]|nr:hypothetical protein [Methanosarcina mazei]
MTIGRKTLDGVPMSQAEMCAQKGLIFDENIPRRDRAKIRRDIRASFTQEELNRISGKDGLIISASQVDEEHSGVYMPRSRGRCAYIVVEDPKNADTVVHEVVHHLREIDHKRIGISKAINPNVKDPRKFRDINNVEEAATVAEAAARTTKPTKRPSGYYGDIDDVKKGRKSKKAAYDEDRKIMTYGTNKPVVGKKAIESVNKNFEKTNISKKKLGTIQAKNSWKKLTDKSGRI